MNGRTQHTIFGINHVHAPFPALSISYPIPKIPVKRKKRDSQKTVSSVLALPIFPGRHQPSIVGRNELNYRVRNGNGWTLVLISTNCCLPVSRRRTFFIIAPSQHLVKKELGDPYRIRTDVNGVRGRCLNHLTNGPWCTFTDSNRGPTD